MSRQTFWEFIQSTTPAVRARLGACIAAAVVCVAIAGWSVSVVLGSGRFPLLRRHPAWVAPVSFPYEVKNLSLSFLDRGHRRTAYAQMTLVLECPTEASRHAMELGHARLLDAINEASSAVTLDDLQSPGGLTRFKERLQAVFMSRFGKLSPRETLIKDWLVN